MIRTISSGDKSFFFCDQQAEKTFNEKKIYGSKKHLMKKKFTVPIKILTY